MNGLIDWWQTLPININPVAFSVGPVDIRWYGLMYIVAFAVVYVLVQYRIKHDALPNLPKPVRLKELVENMFLWGLAGVLIGGRLGYVLFYQFSLIFNDPLAIIWPFVDGKFVGIAGMSFHGGVIGVALAFLIFCRKNKLNLLRFAELFIPAIPLGYMFGRLGNWLNGELWGRITDSAIGQYFIRSSGEALRHPSQLYEAFGEGIILFLILWPLRTQKWSPGILSGIYLAGYGLVRFIIEFFREPDAHLGFIFAQLSMGQLLSWSMVLVGVGLVIWKRKK